jgi:hypothetical protein
MDLSRSQETVLETFSRALRREAHVLTQHPNLLWQQLYNRLQWEGELPGSAQYRYSQNLDPNFENMY